MVSVIFKNSTLTGIHTRQRTINYESVENFVWSPRAASEWFLNPESSFRIECQALTVISDLFALELTAPRHVAGSSASGGSDRRNKEKNGDAQLLLQQRKSDASGGSETETGSVVRAPPSERSLPPPPLDLNNTNQDLSASRQSFRMAMGNPCEFFVDVM